jgi:hypothetical protein
MSHKLKSVLAYIALGCMILVAANAIIDLFFRDEPVSNTEFREYLEDQKQEKIEDNQRMMEFVDSVVSNWAKYDEEDRKDSAFVWGATISTTDSLFNEYMGSRSHK